jgi:hypothetical protein
VIVMLLLVGAAALAMVIRLPTRAPASAAGGRPASSGQLTVTQAGSLITVPELSDLLRSRQTARPAAPSQSPSAPALAAGATPPSSPPAAGQVQGYLNPLRSIAGLVPQRIDMGVDFVGSGPVYALGDGVITNAEGNSAGWPGGGWITYQLTEGAGAGLVVYVAEDVQPTVQPGQHVTSLTVIGNMSAGSEGIETGWAMPDGASAESQLLEAGGIGGDGPFPTQVGLSFDELLVALGVPSAPNIGDTAYGLLPPNYPAHWNAG